MSTKDTLSEEGANISSRFRFLPLSQKEENTWEVFNLYFSTIFLQIYKYGIQG
jgi:hypothetical protein